jgi:iron(III) transport system substrate-binding protein
MRPWRLAAGLLAVVLVPAGCGGSNSTAGSTSNSCDLDVLKSASPTEQQAKLVEGAKAEGQVLLYSAVDEKTDQEWKTGFEKKYPGVKLQFLHLNATDSRDRILTEERAGQHRMDVAVNTALDLNATKAAGVFAENPGKVGIPEGLGDDYYGSWWAAIELIPTLITWNTKLVSPADAPKTYEDLLDPKWKGRVSIDAEPSQFISGLILAWGKDKAETYLKSLVEGNDAQIRRGHTLQLQLLAAGEFAVSSELYGYSVEQLREKGAPVDWIAPPPVPINVTAAAISKNAPHPCAAALAFGYIISKEGQQAVVDIGRTSPLSELPGKHPRLADLIKSSDLSVIDPDSATGDLLAQTNELGKIVSARATG